MKSPQPTQRLRVLLPALAILTALSAYAAVMEKHAGPAQVVQGASAPSAAAPAARAQEASPAEPSAGPAPAPPAAPPAARPARVRTVPAASAARGGEAVGRPNPFAPPGFALPPARPALPSFGLDLPLPPGASVPSAPPPPPPPGAGMTVGAIAGSGSDRVAIIRQGGEIFVVGVGDRVGDAAVVEIRDDKVVMRKGGVTFELPYGGGGP
jgi:hypothetical protein